MEFVNSMCTVQVTSYSCQLKIILTPPKPKNATAPTNATIESIATFRKLVNKMHASPLLTEILLTAQSSKPAAELIVPGG